MRTTDNHKGRMAQSQFHQPHAKSQHIFPLHYHSYQPGRLVARTRLCNYIHAACNKCGFQKKKKKKR
jgi:hypothetical protein